MFWLGSLSAQQSQFMVFEFVKSGNDQNFRLYRVKEFREKCIDKHWNDKTIMDGDFWALQSEMITHFQYVMVTYYNDPVKYLDGFR